LAGVLLALLAALIPDYFERNRARSLKPGLHHSLHLHTGEALWLSSGEGVIRLSEVECL